MMRYTRKIRLDRIGSATTPARLGAIVEVSPDCDASEGAVVVGRALSDKHVYGELELPNGRMAKVVQGNLVAGVLGARQALHGYMGDIPAAVAVGDVLHLLNIGGVIGICDQPNKDLGPPIGVEILGQVIRNGKPLNIKDHALAPCPELSLSGPPICLVLGTCMNSGKTYAAAEIIRVMSRNGVKVAAGKVSGVAALRDLLKMQDNGAIATSSFLDCGLPSTVKTTELGPVARAVVQQLERSNPDVILLELGDGIIGGYNTQSILRDESIRQRTLARVLCANDLVGAWGGTLMLDEMGHRPTVISGPVTDNAVGTTYIEGQLHIASRNARLVPEALAVTIGNALGVPLEAGA
jgi:hypothetical protein